MKTKDCIDLFNRGELTRAKEQAVHLKLFTLYKYLRDVKYDHANAYGIAAFLKGKIDLAGAEKAIAEIQTRGLQPIP